MNSPDSAHCNRPLSERLRSAKNKGFPRIDLNGLHEDLAYWRQVDPEATQKWLLTEEGIEPVTCASDIRKELQNMGVIEAMNDHTLNGDPNISIPDNYLATGEPHEVQQRHNVPDHPSPLPKQMTLFEMKSPDPHVDAMHEIQNRFPGKKNPVRRAISAEIGHEWREKKKQLNLLTTAQKREVLAEFAKQRVQLLALHGIDISQPLTMDQIQYVLEGRLDGQAWDTDLTSGEEVTIFPSEEAWGRKQEIDTHDGE